MALFLYLYTLFQITWVDSNAGVLTQGVTYSVEPMPDGQRFTAR